MKRFWGLIKSFFIGDGVIITKIKPTPERDKMSSGKFKRYKL
jgi:hypothetical protein